MVTFDHVAARNNESEAAGLAGVVVLSFSFFRQSTITFGNVEVLIFSVPLDRSGAIDLEIEDV